jgi:hypothetical protein
MARKRTWTCRKCKTKWPGTRQLCTCGTRRPPRRVPKHQLVLELMPYEEWVEKYGERCGVCGRPPSANRRLDRDHDHQTGDDRGLLCPRCNQALPNWVSVTWLIKAMKYLWRGSMDELRCLIVKELGGPK